MKMHKFEVYVIDFEDAGIESAMQEVERSKYASICVKAKATGDIGKWSDDHELNQRSTPVERFRAYFEPPTQPQGTGGNHE